MLLIFSLEYLLSLKEKCNFNSSRAWPETSCFVLRVSCLCNTFYYASDLYLLCLLAFWWHFTTNKNNKQKLRWTSYLCDEKRARGKRQRPTSDASWAFEAATIVLCILYCTGCRFCFALPFTLPVLTAASLFILKIAISYITAKVTFPTA